MLPIETGLVDDADEELRAAAVRPARRDNRRYRAAQVAGVAQLGIDQTQPPAAVLGVAAGIARQRVAALHDAVEHHAVEGGAVERAVRRQPHHEADVIRGQLRAQIDSYRAQIRLDEHLFAAHFHQRQRGDERLARRLLGLRLLGHRQGRCEQHERQDR